MYHRKWESCETYKEIDRVVVVFKVFLIYSEFSFPGTISLRKWNKFSESAIDYCLFSFPAGMYGPGIKSVHLRL